MSSTRLREQVEAMDGFKLAFYSALMWLLVFFVVGAMTVPWFGIVAGVVAVVGLWCVGIYKAMEQGRRIERLGVAAERARREADEASAIADRLDAEAARVETRSALMWFVTPN
jgi:hypothetical protein